MNESTVLMMIVTRPRWEVPRALESAMVAVDISVC